MSLTGPELHRLIAQDEGQLSMLKIPGGGSWCPILPAPAGQVTNSVGSIRPSASRSRRCCRRRGKQNRGCSRKSEHADSSSDDEDEDNDEDEEDEEHEEYDEDGGEHIEDEVCHEAEADHLLDGPIEAGSRNRPLLDVANNTDASNLALPCRGAASMLRSGSVGAARDRLLSLQMNKSIDHTTSHTELGLPPGDFTISACPLATTAGDLLACAVGLPGAVPTRRKKPRRKKLKKSHLLGQLCRRLGEANILLFSLVGVSPSDLF
ncbi:unnamed protein product [Protopolystoma xenopodis]|uniref:Uncharacterized protein n=1 Tax=Protopolystoma xenopodis TaxID=117903 RepID=A0A3S5B7P2_9PLAT|nr:unnamed protein product [Protopolystoma xenopodis]